MKRKNHSKAGLFLIELMISILFFSITAAVFMQVFVKSDQIRKNSRELFEAQTRVSSLAEMLKQDPDQDNPIEYHYDADWNRCQVQDAVYALRISWTEQDDLIEYHAKVWKEKTNIYELSWKQWRGDQS